MNRCKALACALLLLTCLLAPSVRAEWPVTVTDAAGRQVTVPHQPRAVLLGAGINLVALSLIDPDPVSLLVGWADDTRQYDPGLYAAFLAKFPRLAKVPVVGGGTDESFSLERALTVGADLAIFGAWQAETEQGRQILDRLTAAGVPAVVVDFNHRPLANTAPGMRLLGRVLGREDRANAFADFWEARIDRIRRRVAEHPEPGPAVLMHAYPQPEDCCWAIGETGLGELVSLVGGRNIAADRFPDAGGGVLSLEYVIGQDPQVYIATGLPEAEGGRGFSIGPGVPAETARQGLARVLAAPGLSGLAAARDGRVHGLWNFFNAVPLNIVAVEAVARWVRPEIFGDLDPGATLAEINSRFAAMPFDGALWVSLDPARDRPSAH
ncbi:ABC transporter substrate-binding protein [Inquilinus sp. Marseille-Q2685]|uniref:ABC transporter substrate-binding protein n=1 Tax=Inquilinus sp. Marseille-Q2685 TaxID=2866581 RepID=UPI001CE3BE63|nr:ABC transporter substrate-binding protein [Inquilinus sp. Marseille-Q2685]